jgi:hypothetical protein
MESKLVVLPLDELIAHLRVVIREEIKAEQQEADQKLISPAAACKLFEPQISKPTLASWTKKGLLTMYRISGRTFYKQSEVLESAITFKSVKK